MSRDNQKSLGNGILRLLNTLWCVLAVLTSVFSAEGAQRQYLHGHRPEAAAQAAVIGRLDATNRMDLNIGLPFRDKEGLTNLLEQLYDPGSPLFHHFLNSDQFAERFAPTEEDYQAVIAFAKANGLTVKATTANRAFLDVSGSVADVERVFHVKMNRHRHPTEDREFFAPDTEPSMDLDVPVLAIGGFDNLIVPHPANLASVPLGGATPAGTGSATNGAYRGNDFRAAYSSGHHADRGGPVGGVAAI